METQKLVGLPHFRVACLVYIIRAEGERFDASSGRQVVYNGLGYQHALKRGQGQGQGQNPLERKDHASVADGSGMGAHLPLAIDPQSGYP